MRGPIRIDGIDGDLALPAVVVDPTGTGAVLSVSDSSLTSLAGPLWPATMSDVRLVNLPSLASLDGLSGIDELGSLFVENTPALHDLSGLTASPIETVVLHDVEATAALGVVEAGAVDVAGSTSALANLAAADSVIDVGSLTGTSLSGLSSLSSVGGLDLESIADADLSGLAALRTVEGRGDGVGLRLGGAMTSLDGLSPDLAVGRIEIVGARELEDLRGLAGIITVTSLAVISNQKLTSLAGVEDFPLTFLEVTANPLLAQCLVDELFAAKGLTNPNPNGNRSGCTCDAGVATCPYEVCFESYFPGEGDGTQGGGDLDLTGVTCAQSIEVAGPAGPATFTAPDLINATQILLASTVITARASATGACRSPPSPRPRSRTRAGSSSAGPTSACRTSHRSTSAASRTSTSSTWTAAPIRRSSRRRSPRSICTRSRPPTRCTCCAAPSSRGAPWRRTWPPRPSAPSSSSA